MTFWVFHNLVKWNYFSDEDYIREDPFFYYKLKHVTIQLRINREILFNNY